MMHRLGSLQAVRSHILGLSEMLLHQSSLELLLLLLMLSMLHQLGRVCNLLSNLESCWDLGSLVCIGRRLIKVALLLPYLSFSFAA